jgi:hypothetical protein
MDRYPDVCDATETDKHATMPTDQPLSYDQLASIALAVYMKQGFRGLPVGLFAT